MSAFEVKHAYLPAKSNSAGAGASAALSSPEDLAADYKPTLEECTLLTEPIDFFLSQCTCYDMMGMSTQVVVVDVEATLAVAFIAAQETRVQSCVLWDSRRREFVGVLSSTDYIKILLYCEAHPAEAEQVSSWTIRHWREVKDKAVTPALMGAPADAASAGAKKTRPVAIVTCTAEASLKDCLEKMKDFNVRRIVAVAEKEASFSVIAMIDVAQIVEYLGVMFFHIEKAGGTLWSSDLVKTPLQQSARGKSGGGGGDSSNNSSVRGPLGAPSGLSPERSASAGGGVPSEPGSARRQGGNAAGAPTANTGNNASRTASEVMFGLGDATTLPPHVSSILAAAESTEAAAMEPRVGPYRSIFDIPLKNLPANVGAHRRTPICVSMDSALNEALKLMLRNDLESIAVCTPDHIILDVVSRSDLLRMETQGVYDTTLTVREALASKISESIYVIYEQDTARDIFAHFVRRRVKELFIVDPDTGKLQGQLNVSEFVFFLVFAFVRDGGAARSAADAKKPAAGKSPNQSTTSPAPAPASAGQKR